MINFTWSINNTIYYLKRFLLLSGNIELNPGPKKSPFIKFCHRNLKGQAAYDFIKIPLVEAYIKNYNFEIVCLSETFLDSTVPTNHPTNIIREGVCIYFKNFENFLKILHTFCNTQGQCK